MLNNLLNNFGDRVGEYNPQLLREFKSRLSWRNAGIAVLLSVVAQVMVLLSQYSKLPTADQNNNSYYYNSYCLKFVAYEKCQLDVLGNPLINWPKWWADSAFGISLLMFFSLFAGGVYLLASNFSQEERRGTLDFIRLTPQRAGSILGGKVLGVPILVYLGTLLALPLQLFAVQQAHIARINVVSWDLLMLSVAVLLYLGAILATLWFKAQSILLAAATLFTAYPLTYLSVMWYMDRSKYISWYGLHLGNHVFSYLLWMGLTSAGIYWLYQAIQRRYLQPTATVLSKGQSYIFSLIYQLGLLGFAVEGNSIASYDFFHPPFGLSERSSNDFGEMAIGTFAFGWLMLLVPLLLPSRQSLVEWSRQRPAGKKRSLLVDLVWHDKSPAMLAVAINMAIATVVWLPVSLFFLDRHLWPQVLLGILMTTVLVVSYSLIAHWGLFWKMNQRQVWTAGIVGGLVFLPIIFGSIVSFTRSTSENPAFLFSPFLWTSIKQVDGTISFGIFLAMLVVMIWLNFKLWRILKHIGHSESYHNFAKT